MYDIRISFPGSMFQGVALLDLETRKIDLANHYILPNGRTLRRRWSAFAAGVATSNGIRLLATNSEETLLAHVSNAIGSREVKYAATRQFDEMILKGRFTNAREKHAENSFYPSMPFAEQMKWTNIYKRVAIVHQVACRTIDVESKNVPKMWAAGAHAIVLIHLLRDVCELMLGSGDNSQESGMWCLKVLRDSNFAASLVGIDLGPHADV
jgi:hypothetical protein